MPRAGNWWIHNVGCVTAKNAIYRTPICTPMLRQGGGWQERWEIVYYVERVQRDVTMGVVNHFFNDGNAGLDGMEQGDMRTWLMGIWTNIWVIGYIVGIIRRSVICA